VCGDTLPSLSKSRLRRTSVLAGIAVGVALSGAGAAQAANNPGTGDTGFFTFRPSTAVGGTQINVASGNALVRTRDLADSDGNYHVVVDRAYNSLASDAFSILSPRWGFDVGPATKVAVQGNGDALVTGPSGYRLLFVKQPDGTFKAPAGFDGSLLKTPTGWTLSRTSQGDQFGFNGSGQLSWTKDRQARDFTVQGTSAAGRDVLSSYGTNSGRRVNLSYTGDSLVREMDDPSSGHHYYSYTGGKLTSYRSPSGAETTYRYASNGYLDKITEASGTTVELTTTASGKVQSITTTLPGAVGQTTSFVYTRRPYKTDVTGPNGVRRTYAYDDDWRVTRQYNPDAKPTVAAAGALRDLAGQYTRGVAPIPVFISANEPDGAGLVRLAAEEVGGSEVAHLAPPCAATLFDRICPQVYAGDTTADLSGLSEGRHELRATATDDENNTGSTSSWSVLIDRTAPTPRGTVDAVLDEDDGTADLTWDPTTDPALPTGEHGSGFERYEVRTRSEGGTWSPALTLAPTDYPTVDLGPHATGDRVEYEIKAYDKLGNVSTASATLPVSLTEVTGSDDGDLAPGESSQPTGPSDPGESAAWRDVDPNGEIVSSAPAGDADGGTTPLSRGLATPDSGPLMAAASGYHKGLCREDGYSSPCGRYSGREAAAYARKFALTDNGSKRNRDYNYFESDCTNFVSQALHFGGLRFTRTAGVNDPRHDDHDLYETGPGSWWSQKYTSNLGKTKYRNTTSWSVAWVLYNQLLDHGLARVVGANERLHSGDVAFYWWQGRSKISDIDHINIIAGVRKRQVYVAQHSKDRLQTLKSWTKLAVEDNPNADRVVLRPVATRFDLP
jgi:YD repeat-containing protein